MSFRPMSRPSVNCYSTLVTTSRFRENSGISTGHTLTMPGREAPRKPTPRVIEWNTIDVASGGRKRIRHRQERKTQRLCGNDKRLFGMLLAAE